MHLLWLMQNPNHQSLEFLSCLSLFDKSVRLADFIQPSIQGFLSPEFSEGTFNPTDAHDKALRVQERCRELGAQIIFPSHAHYPEVFLELEVPPLFLSVLGPGLENLGAPLERCLSVVGSREPSVRALDWLDAHLPPFLEATGAIVASGGARGIDQRAHAASLRADLPTLVFLPSGLARPYPAEMMKWEDEVIRRGGALISCHAPEMEIRRHFFEDRNRLIAALSSVVFVAEGRRRSGSLMTARLARELSRTVAVLPSFPGEVQSAGTLDLLFDGAQPVRDACDLKSLFNLVRAGRAI